MAETLAELSVRVDELERVILELVRSAKRNEIKAAVKARKDGCGRDDMLRRSVGMRKWRALDPFLDQDKPIPCIYSGEP